MPDLTHFYEQHKSVQPYLINDDITDVEHYQSKEDRSKLDGLYECAIFVYAPWATPLLPLPTRDVGASGSA